jgi:hypothetical protein
MVVHVQLHQTELWGREGEKLDKAHIDKKQNPFICMLFFAYFS